MDIEKKQEFTRRISQSNRTGLLVVEYEIWETYIEEARCALKQDDYPGLKQAIEHADQVLVALSNALDFKYELSVSLYALYQYARRAIRKSIIKKTADGMEEAYRLIHPIHESFAKIAKEDNSESLMQNTQQVYAGMTYGKNQLNEDCADVNQSRGFLA